MTTPLWPVVSCVSSKQTVQELGSLVVATDWQGSGVGYLSDPTFNQRGYPADLFGMCGRSVGYLLPSLGVCVRAVAGSARPLRFKFGLSTLARTLLHIPFT